MGQMGLRWGQRTACIAWVGWQLLACGGSGAAGGTGPSGGASATAGAPGYSGGGASAVGGASGASSGMGGGAGAPASSAGSPDCSGDFGMPAVVLAQTSNIKIASETESPDQLELIYTQVDENTKLASFVHLVRNAPSDPFAAASPLPELDAACQTTEDRNSDLSSDGLRLYIVCFSDQAPAQPSLHIADRAALQAPFTVRATSAPIVGISLAISSDELTLYSSGDPDAQFPAPLQYQRPTVTSDFGAAEPIPGLSMVNLASPEPTPDGLTMYGSVMGSLVVSARTSATADFGAPRVLVQFEPMDLPTPEDLFGSPALSRDCRSLYFVQQEVGQSTVSGSLWVMRR